ncbi:MAG: glycosyltransferase family 4 protein, partial [Puniceicoccales bacterium]
MRILAIQDYLRVGGTESQFLDLTARWAAEGHEVQRLLFRRGGGLFSLSQSRGPAPVFLQPVATPWNWWSPGLLRAIRKFEPDRIIAFGRNAHWSLGRKIRGERISGLVATLRTGRTLPTGYRRILTAAEVVVTNSVFAAGIAKEQGA